MMMNLLDAAEPGVHPPVAEVDLPDGIQVAFTDDRDLRHVVDLEDAAAVEVTAAQRRLERIASRRGPVGPSCCARTSSPRRS